MPTETQLRIIDSILNIVNVWRETDNLESPVQYNIIEEELSSNLSEYVPQKQLEYLANEIDKILCRIIRNKC